MQKIRYESYGNTTVGTTYCSGVESFAENLIEDNEEDAVIVSPAKDAWARLRSIIGYNELIKNQ